MRDIGKRGAAVHSSGTRPLTLARAVSGLRDLAAMAITADDLPRVDCPGLDDPGPQPLRLRLRQVGPQLVRQQVEPQVVRQFVPQFVQQVVQPRRAWLPCPRSRAQVSGSATAIPAMLWAGLAGGATDALMSGGWGAGWSSNGAWGCCASTMR